MTEYYVLFEFWFQGQLIITLLAVILQTWQRIQVFVINHVYVLLIWNQINNRSMALNLHIWFCVHTNMVFLIHTKEVNTENITSHTIGYDIKKKLLDRTPLFFVWMVI